MKSKDRHIHDLRHNGLWLSWKLTGTERKALHGAFWQFVNDGQWATDTEAYLLMVTLMPYLQVRPAVAGRLRLNESECTTFFLLFKKHYDPMLRMDGMGYLPIAMCGDIERYFFTKKQINLV